MWWWRIHCSRLLSRQHVMVRCTNITDSLRGIDESAVDSYEQLKALLVLVHQGPLDQSIRVVKAPGNRRHEANRPDATDKDPAAMDSRPCTVFMTMFLLRLPSEMREQTDC
jgi:hypothetical protein